MVRLKCLFPLLCILINILDRLQEADQQPPFQPPHSPLFLTVSQPLPFASRAFHDNRPVLLLFNWFPFNYISLFSSLLCHWYFILLLFLLFLLSSIVNFVSFIGKLFPPCTSLLLFPTHQKEHFPNLSIVKLCSFSRWSIFYFIPLFFMTSPLPMVPLFYPLPPQTRLPLLPESIE